MVSAMASGMILGVFVGTLVAPMDGSALPVGIACGFTVGGCVWGVVFANRISTDTCPTPLQSSTVRADLRMWLLAGFLLVIAAACFWIMTTLGVFMTLLCALYLTVFRSRVHLTDVGLTAQTGGSPSTSTTSSRSR